MSENLESLVAVYGLDTYKRHIFICADQTEAKCCTKEAGLESWNFLKRRLKELKLSEPQALVYRTKANCFRICTQGPIALIYPEQVWYHSCSPDVLEKIIQQHLIQGSIVEEYCFQRRPNPGN
ncbi:MAG: (2Fe-2S) ferredoxin [Verrucomicrobiales bacterium]|nr:(2Fe-2S) ferredoxin [Verrucomicrobiales bacterium]